MILGVHVSAAGNIYQAPEVAHKLGCNTMQLFSRTPQQWRHGFIDASDIQEFVLKRKKYKISPVFIHISYLINLASPDRRLYKGSVKAYIEDMREADDLGADYIVTHMGSHKATSEEEGIKRLVKALNKIIEATQDAKVGILLENTSGSGSWLGYKFEHQRRILDGIKDRKRIGLCLDTAHAFVAGYDLSTKEGLEETIAEIDAMVGIGLVKLIHLNDARDKLGTRCDRHQHIGKGYIGLEGMRRIVNHPKLKNLPFILETPKDSRNTDKINLKIVRSLRK